MNLLMLSQAELLTEDNHTVQGAVLWKSQPAILIFLRHFKCAACKGHAAQVWARREEYEKHGAMIYFIGNGDPSTIKDFKRQMGIENAPILTNPSLSAFRAVGFRRGFLATFNMQSVKNTVELAKEGHRHKLPIGNAGDRWQLGGVVVINTAGKVTYQFISEAVGDFPPEKDVEAIAVAGAADAKPKEVAT